MSVTDWQTWAPFVDALRRSAPPGTHTSEFVGTVGRGGAQGTYLDDGDAAARRDRDRELALAAARTGGPGPRAELDEALREVAALLPDSEQLVRVVAVHGGGGLSGGDRPGGGAPSGGDARDGGDVRDGDDARDRGDARDGGNARDGGDARNRGDARDRGASPSGDAPVRDVVELITLPPAVVSGPTAPVLEVVLEPGALPASYREIVEPRPDAATAPSADPDAVARVVAERMPDAVGAAPEEIDAAEVALPDGARLPAEVRSLYAAAGSGALKLAPEEGRFGGFEIVPLSGSALREAFLPAARFGTWTADAGTVAPRDPADRVQAVIGSPLWFPVGTDGAGNVYAVDLAPGPAGHLGQVVLLDHEVRAGATYRAESLAALLVGRVAPPDRPERTTDAGGASPAGPGAVDGPVEFLALDPADWMARLDAGTVPDTLKAAGLVPDRANPPILTDALAVADRLLALRGLPPTEVVRLTRPARAERKGLLGRLFGR
ncbi:SMI1/KNR4 family protein [Promicromonospora sp. MS192]|uniref:SMI1/KNR4 family protein n=1 Tax=Promicromonospora sp. MS192 TaxID=3412684 RepID=UPI003C2AF74B